VRAHAALALWRVDANRDGPAMAREAQHHHKYSTAITGLEALWAMEKDPETLEFLIRELQEGIFTNDPMRSNHLFMAARALKRVGSPAKAALPWLGHIRCNEDYSLRLEVAAAIAAIEGK